MLEVGWSEILVIALILIIVVGPKDLPGMLRNFGKMATRVRSMANDFKGQFDQAMREAELEEVSKGLGEVRKLNPTNSLRDAINPIRQLGQDLKTDLQKASDFSAKPAVDEGTKVSELASDPAIDPEPVKSEPAKPEAAKAEPAPETAASALPPYAAMPVVNATPDEVMAKVKRRKADVADAAALATQPAVTEGAKKPSRKKTATRAAEADPFPPPAKKKVTRKAAEKHTEHNVQVVSSEDAAVAPSKKAAPRKKSVKAGDA